MILLVEGDGPSLAHPCFIDFLVDAVRGHLLDLRKAAGDQPLHVVVDRQGGRKFYGDGLQEAFPSGFVWTLNETPQESRYRVEADGRETVVSFRTKADVGSFPAAAASMVSKYVRELLMARLNGFFRRHDNMLKPTAGYPGDAKRFLDQTAAIRETLQIGDADFIRSR